MSGATGDDGPAAAHPWTGASVPPPLSADVGDDEPVFGFDARLEWALDQAARASKALAVLALVLPAVAGVVSLVTFVAFHLLGALLAWDLFAYFRQGGPLMYPALYAGMLAHVHAVLAAAATRSVRRTMPLGFGAATLLWAVTTVGLAVVGFADSIATTDGALALADPAAIAILRAEGYGYARNNLYLGAFACALPTVVGLVALARGAILPESAEA
jgi:hypothetical protein